ncbi:hypothetical protein PVK06_030993 [Gossypium arboreum]|uniref:Uncharacterized protein n=1 Tax=Gossypium arboreum TaxID=29729 RepID=A0ABR0NSZ9_GOSAR|nr:hypothetical protein PVK06_030993 [Gossypium arboreum]
MAIESQHMNQNLPPQLIMNRYFMKTNEGMYKDNLMDSCVPLQQASFAKLFDPILASNSIDDMGMRRGPKDSFINNAFGSSMDHIQLHQLDGFIAQHDLNYKFTIELTLNFETLANQSYLVVLETIFYIRFLIAFVVKSPGDHHGFSLLDNPYILYQCMDSYLSSTGLGSGVKRKKVCDIEMGPRKLR